MITHRFQIYSGLQVCDSCGRKTGSVCEECVEDKKLLCQSCHANREDDLEIADDESNAQAEKSWEANAER